MDLQKLNQALNLYVRPQSFPLAIRMCESAAELPEKTRLPVRDLKMSITICQGVGMARRYGWTLAIGKEDQLCPWGSVAMGFLPAKKEFLDGSIAEKTGHWPKEVLAKMAQEMKRFDPGKYSYVLLAPIDRATFEPHVVVIYGNSAQVMRLVQGCLFNRGGGLLSNASGSADCADIICQTMLSDECHVVLPCGGDRVFGLTQDHEIAFTISPSKFDLTIQGLEAGHKSGAQRYPIPSYFRFQPEMPPAYQKLMEFLKV